MARLVLRRFARFVVVLLLVTVAAAFLLELVPGEPALVLAGETASPEAIAEINERYGFDQPVFQRYAEWLGNFLQGDLGSSYRTNVPVLDSIRARLPVTLEIAVLATLVATCVSVPLGIATGSRAGTRRDRLVGAGGSAVISLPSFLVAIILVYVFAIKLEWFPVTGWSSLSDGVVDNLRSVALPVISVALTEVVILQRVLRSEMIDTLDQPYIAMATAKGMSRRYVLWRHALKPSSFGLLTLSSLSLARLVGGTVIVETVFSLPGIGRLLVTAIQDRDLVVVQGIVAFIAVVYLCINLVVDLLYSVLDPRVRAVA